MTPSTIYHPSQHLLEYGIPVRLCCACTKDTLSSSTYYAHIIDGKGLKNLYWMTRWRLTGGRRSLCKRMWGVVWCKRQWARLSQAIEWTSYGILHFIFYYPTNLVPHCYQAGITKDITRILINTYDKTNWYAGDVLYSQALLNRALELGQHPPNKIRKHTRTHSPKAIELILVNAVGLRNWDASMGFWTEWGKPSVNLMHPFQFGFQLKIK